MLDYRIHWIGMTDCAYIHAVMIADNDTTVPIIFSGIFGVG